MGSTEEERERENQGGDRETLTTIFDSLLGGRFLARIPWYVYCSAINFPQINRSSSNQSPQTVSPSQTRNFTRV